MTFIEMRSLTGLGQKDFAERYNIPYRTYEKWERGETNCVDIVLPLLERATLEDSAPDFPKKPNVLNFTAKRLLDFSHMTRKEFSEKYGINIKTLNNWVNGNYVPKPYIINLLERFVREDTMNPWRDYIERKRVDGQ